MVCGRGLTKAEVSTLSFPEETEGRQSSSLMNRSPACGAFSCPNSFGCGFPLNPLQWALRTLRQGSKWLCKTVTAETGGDGIWRSVSSPTSCLSARVERTWHQCTQDLIQYLLIFSPKQIITSQSWMSLHFLSYLTISTSNRVARKHCSDQTWVISGKGADQHWGLAR